MEREVSLERRNWTARCEEVGFDFHSLGGKYWDESACYRFSVDEIDHLEDTAAELHRMCLEAVGELMGTRAWEKLAIPEWCVPYIEASWAAREPSLYGRFDLAYDGHTPAKLLEYNADTPTSVLEASVVQWHWLKDKRASADQFNSLHEALIAQWQYIKAGLQASKCVYFSCVGDNAEDFGNLEYLRDTALQAGIDARFIDIKAIGWDSGRRCFVDMANEPITTLFKLYPWEWLMQEHFGQHIPQSGTAFIEPAWKMLLSNKAILAALWELFPGHPNLLPAYFDADRISGPKVRKPLLSREGANITLYSDKGRPLLETCGTYGAEGYVYQAMHALPEFDGNYPVIGAWIVGDAPAGIGIREENNPVTTNMSRFVPHYFN